MKRFLFLVSLLFVAGMGCKADSWMGFYYPNGCLHCEDDWILQSNFSSLEECRNWADWLELRSGNPSDLYECGKNCRSNGGLGHICEETVD